MKFAKLWSLILMAYQIILSHAQQTVKVPVKRVHSRHRRFIAPGAVWDLMVGVEVIGSDYELRYNAFVRYRMDYLFGGTAALASVIAQANAAAKAENTVKEQLALLQSGKRKKRSSDPNDVVAAGFGRSFSNPTVTDDISNVLKRTIVDDQIDVLGKIEQSLDKGGLAGRQCVLRAICELTETPIHHWTVFGEMLNNLLRPKNGTHEALEEYKKAEKIGEEQGDCWSFYPECPISIFNVIPDVYTTDDQVEVSFDGFDSGSKFDASNNTSEGPYSDPEENSIDDDILNLVKNGGIDGIKVKEHNIDIDFTT
jgi:hypothetical protein